MDFVCGCVAELGSGKSGKVSRNYSCHFFSDSSEYNHIVPYRSPLNFDERGERSVGRLPETGSDPHIDDGTNPCVIDTSHVSHKPV